MDKMTWGETLQLLTDAAKSMEAVQHLIEPDAGENDRRRDALVFSELMLRRTIERITVFNWKELESEAANRKGKT